MYIVLAHRWGDVEGHTYVVGIFDSLRDAVEVAIAEEYWRGGKYECRIQRELNPDLSEKTAWCAEACLPDDEFEDAVQKRIEDYHKWKK